MSFISEKGEDCMYIYRSSRLYCEEPIIANGLAYCVMHELMFRADHPGETSADSNINQLNKWEFEVQNARNKR